MALILYTDGNCLHNGKDRAIAGIGVFHEPGSKYNVSERSVPGKQTNERAEIHAAIRALEITFGDTDVTSIEIRTDSEYVVRGMTMWMKSWKRNGWRTASKKPVKNQELWMRLDQLARTHPAVNIAWKHVRGHSGVVGNERADRLAHHAMVRLSPPPMKQQKRATM